MDYRWDVFDSAIQWIVVGKDNRANEKMKDIFYLNKFI